ILAAFLVCSTSQSRVARAETTERNGNRPKGSLIPVPPPILNGMEKMVQEQIRDAESVLSSLLQNSRATTEELVQGYGQMGKLYQAYDLTDAALACYLNAQSLDPGNFAWQYYVGY